MVELKMGVGEGREGLVVVVEALTLADARVAGPGKDRVADKVKEQDAKDR